MDKRLKKFEDKYSGKRAFVVGNGPNLKFNDLRLLKDEYVFICNSFSFHKDYPFLKYPFYCISGGQYWAWGYNSPMLYNSQKVNKSSLYFYNVDFLPVNLKYHYFSKDKVYYFIWNSPSVSEGAEIELDITKSLHLGGTVIMDLMLPIAFYMGFKDIYLIGVDTDMHLDTSPDWKDAHFYPLELPSPAEKWELKYRAKGVKIKELEPIYSKFKKLFEKNNRMIYNAGYGGKLSVFERIDFESLFKT